MPDLPGATPELDRLMFDDVLDNPDLQADQWKIYPCMTTPFSVIQNWYEQGKYRSYGLEELMQVIMYAKRKVHPWIRLNRVIRDIPVEYVLEGIEVSNLRQLLQIELKKQGRGCRCIRCREIKSAKDASSLARTAVLRRREYAGNRGREIFLSFETPDEEHLFAFLRLRIVTQADQSPDEASPFPELAGCALIRELHVYGNLVVSNAAAAEVEVRPNASGVDEEEEEEDQAAKETPLSRKQRAGGTGSAVQHMGFGTRLLAAAESVAVEAGATRAAVISGIGVRGFYRRRGYEVVEGPGVEGGFMIKPVLDLSAAPVVDGAGNSASAFAADTKKGWGRPRRVQEPRFLNAAVVAAACLGVAVVAAVWPAVVA
jgi:histone acetyltransferase (RNA polymerase elongator complex component)